MSSIFTERKKNCGIKAKTFNPLQRSSFDDMLICKKIFNIYYNIQYYSQCFIKKSDMRLRIKREQGINDGGEEERQRYT